MKRLATEGTRLVIVHPAFDSVLTYYEIDMTRRETGAIVTAEDHNIHGGLGGAVAEALAATHPCPIEFVGVRDTFGASGEPEELAHHFGISAPFIAEAVKRVIARKTK